jgi:adenosylhomocysteine nucleosidase
MNRIAIIAAMPGELKPLTRGWRHERSNGVDLWRSSFDQGEWVAACAGAGAEAATRAFAEAEKAGPISVVISVGWAGALTAECTPGLAYSVSAVFAADTGERFDTAESTGKETCEAVLSHSGGLDSLPGLWLVTASTVADVKEKRRLAAAYSAGLVDMEATTVARLAKMRGVPFYCIKGVSDGYRGKLPDFNNFISPAGKFRLVAFIFSVVLRPWYWRALIRMGEDSKEAALNLARFQRDFPTNEAI